MKIYLKNDLNKWEIFEGKKLIKQLKKNNITLGDDVKISDGVVIGYGVKIGDRVVIGKDVKIDDNVKIGDRVTIDNDVKIGNDVTLGDDATLSDKATLNKDYTKEQLIMASLGVYPYKGKYILYKRVNKISDGKYASCYDHSFIYEDGKISKAKTPNMSKNVSCASGLHVSTPFYWNKGDTLIQVEVNTKDVITCLCGKIRCTKLKVIGEVK